MIVYKIFRAVVFLFWKLLYPIRTLGRKNFPKKGGVVAVCNHTGLADPVHAVMGIPRKMEILGKREVVDKAGIFGGFLRYLGLIPVNRDKPEPSSIRLCVQKLKAGRALLLYPEGKRNKTGEDLLPLKGGMGLFALMAKVPIVPMYQLGKAKFFRKNYLVVGVPIDLSGYYGRRIDETLLSEIDELVRSRMLELIGRLPEKFVKKQRARMARDQIKTLQKTEKKAARKDKGKDKAS